MPLPSRLSIAVTAALSLVGAGLTWSVYEIETSRREVTFVGALVEMAGYVETRVEQHIALLSATRSFLAVEDEPTSREDFAAFVGGLQLDNRYPGLQELGFARTLLPGDEAQVEDVLSQAYGGERLVWGEARSGLRTAIVLLEPDDRRHHTAIGFDMATEEEHRGAMLEARETGTVTATPPLILAQGITEAARWVS